MAYQVIARKWRPQSFDQLVGQAHISQTLINALKNNRLPHALLFTGPRGTGKTSSARILAKSLRCPNSKDFVPCNECSSCQDIAVGRSIDVLELDGASNNGVDAIRDLRDGVAFMPSSGKYRIYIIDEVHMLSTSAFNALLKTLEEPPEHVVFILATTEVHKIPQTILSRCQRFDFRNIPTRQIAESLKIICERENVQADDEALWAIARQGDGSMRDSQSLLDQVITFSDGILSRKTVVEILGLTDRSLLLETLTSLTNRDVSKMLECLEKIHQAGYDPSLFADDLLENIRNLLFIKMGTQKESSIIELPDSEIRFLKDLGSQISEEDIHMLFDMMLKGANDLPRASEPQIVLEMVLLRMVYAPKIISMLQLFSGAQSTQLNEPAQAAQQQRVQAAQSLPIHQSRRVDPIGLNPAERWLDFVQNLRNSDALFAAKIENLTFVGLKEKVIHLGIPSKMSFLKEQLADTTLRKKLKCFIDQHWGADYTLEITLSKEGVDGQSAQTLAQQKEKIKEDDVAKQVAEHPLVKAATSALKGHVKAIKNFQTE